MTETSPPAFSLDWPFACGAPTANAVFRAVPEDFRVDEIFDIEPSGSGEHVMLLVRKRGENTGWVAKQIAELAGVKPMDVGYCGLKDRHAVTTQWFSVYLGTRTEADWTALNSDSVAVLRVARHHQKLRRGMHTGNRFSILLREFDGDRTHTEQRLLWLQAHGAPNYFGDQRFGRGVGNLPRAQRMLVEGERVHDKQLKGLIISAARSYLFNQVLAARVRQQTWLERLEGDVAGSELSTGPLWGRGRPLVSAQLLGLESEILAGFADWANALEHVGLSQERRVLVMPLGDLTWQWEGDGLRLDFHLGVGCFATALLRELAELRQMSAPVNML